MIKAALAILSITFLISSCRTTDKEAIVTTRDTTITVSNAYSELFLDSSQVAEYSKFTSAEDSIRLLSFYNQRNFQMAWFFPDGMSEVVTSFLSMQLDYLHYSGDSSLYNPALLASIEALEELERINPRDSNIIHTELALTNQFFKYSQKVYNGDAQLDVHELNWYIPRKKLDLTAFLDSLILNNGKDVARYEPINIQYNLLKNKLSECYAYGDRHWVTLSIKKVLKIKDQDPVLRHIKDRMYFYGDLPHPDTTQLFDSTMLQGVKRFQKRMGLRQDGEIGPAFMREINVPLTTRIQQILINMERMRWLPPTPTSDYLLVNIPEYTLHVYEQGQLAFNMAVVVGSQAHSTVIFSGNVSQIVFSPYWNIPNSILKNEILPGIRRNRNYLAKHNMEWVGNRVRQKPGVRNSLGLVKFLFPNSYNIYLHDTPSKSLFSESTRAFSHGCIRLSEPTRLAEFLLRKDSLWTPARIEEAMQAGKEKYVALPKQDQVPVFIGYFTCWVDQEGELNFRRDIYGHDQKMAKRLFKEAVKNGTE
ncbi:murein L,D-transpeptidase YcbB/YkuD [Dyadobacter jejuensis]|uniref:Murein L,D-transpeptidase YcbB/YkuD n=1 Tax=Dyadobacter jejuensis TaxID=1082580 RepID=A0A316APR3_9BACT|nr:L,D-transpeptidase family protein [Dyadobacter jejuensis]PWJ58810.1 murein L,D-transpeptidase YcbB/YkuD [Dyadobacter jejuensis]